MSFESIFHRYISSLRRSDAVLLCNEIVQIHNVLYSELAENLESNRPTSQSIESAGHDWEAVENVHRWWRCRVCGMIRGTLASGCKCPGSSDPVPPKKGWL